MHLYSLACSECFNNNYLVYYVVKTFLHTFISIDDANLSRSFILKLLDELLRVASDFVAPREERDDITLKSPLPEAPEAAKLQCSPNFVADIIATTSDSMDSEQSDEDGTLQWILALERLLPGVLRHSSPMVSFVLEFSAVT